MSDVERHQSPPAPNVLWGRVAAVVVVVLLAFGLGRCSAPGVSEEAAAELESRVADLSTENGDLRTQLDRFRAEDEAEEPTDSDPTTPTTPSIEPDTGTVPTESATSSATEVPTEEPATGGQIYVVEPGDTLFGIAIELYGDRERADEIADLNGLTRSSTLSVGQELRLPG